MDPTDVLVAFAQELRRAGVAVSTDRIHAMLVAIHHLQANRRTELYWAGRLMLCGDHSDIEKYDRLFAVCFGGLELGTGESVSAPAAGQPGAGGDLLVSAAGPEEAATDKAVDHRRGGSWEVLSNKEIAPLTRSERFFLDRLVTQLAPAGRGRRTRRYEPAPRGSINRPATIRRLLSARDEPAALAWARRRTVPRRLVVLIDVSESMTGQSEQLLRFGLAAVRSRPGRTEVFTLGTRTTRITRELRRRNVDEALARAAEAVSDWGGGTRLGVGMKVFLDRWGRGGLARGSVVVVGSDGWEDGDARPLGVQLERLARIAHRIVWINPVGGDPNFVAMAGGLRVAAPFVDHWCAGRTVPELESAAHLIALF
jgi:uncharacterized protein with von Willebrand factor type A (vWA) domain